jgi:HSP20 family molecular chaperone IbpA
MKKGIIAYAFPLLRRFGEEIALPPGLFSPSLEVVETEELFTVRADVPGMRREEIRVEVAGPDLTIAGERKPVVERDAGGVYCSERNFGAFFRAVPLPARADVQRLSATVKDGVLEILLPLRIVFIAMIAGALGLIAAPAQAQQVTRCAECHLANLNNVPAPGFLSDWQRSAHARRGVGCDKCHGGDPWTDHPTEAHRGVLNSSNARSLVHPANLTLTCGQCHRAIAAAFTDSRHQSLIGAGDAHAPTCATCHGAMRARTVTPTELETRCAGCHPGDSPLAGYPLIMRTSLERLDAARLRCDDLAASVDRIREDGRRLTLKLAVSAAYYTIREAVAAAHAFNVAGVDERVAAAKKQIDAIGESLSATR